MAQLVTLDQAADRLGIGRRTIQRWIQTGKARRFKAGGDRKVYVDLVEIRRLMKPQPQS